MASTNSLSSQNSAGLSEPIIIVEAAAITECGPVRTNNQDAILVQGKIAQRSGTRLTASANGACLPFTAAVIDGMGGYAGGDDAALLTAIMLSRYDFVCCSSSEINESCDEFSDRILAAGHAWGTPDMGSAFALLSIDSASATVANIGDCRVYHLVEHTFGLLTKDDRNRGSAGGITQSLGGRSIQHDAHAYSVPLQNENIFLLCSDGVWSSLDDGILSHICETLPPLDAVRNIVFQCQQIGAPDNCSAIVVHVKSLRGV